MQQSLLKNKLKIAFWSLKFSFQSSPALAIINIVFSIILGGSVVLNVYLYKYYVLAIQDVLNGSSIFDAFFLLLIVQSLVLISNTIIINLQNNINETFRNKIVIKLNDLIFNKIKNINLAEFESEHLYNQLSLIDHNNINIGVSIIHSINMISEVIALSSMVIILLSKIPLGLVIIIAAQISFIFIKYNEDYTNWGVIVAQSKDHRYIGYLANLFTQKDALVEMKVFNNGRHLIKKIDASRNNLYKKNIKVLIKNLVKQNIQNIITYTGLALNYIIIAAHLAADIIDLASGVMLFSLVTTFAIKLNLINTYFASFVGTGLRLSNLYNFLYTDTIKEIPSNENIEIVKVKKITFEDVSFRYPNCSQDTLKDLNITITLPNQIAIIGENGSGKTTFIKLLCGLYNPTKGRIFYNDVDLSLIPSAQKSQLISSIFQDFGIYNISVQENITFSENDHTDEINKLTKRFPKANFSSDNSNTLNESLGVVFGNKQLSKGQNQQIALMRLLFGQKEIYLLDEPTASLDPELEKEVFDIVKELTKDKLAIYVTHRLKNIKEDNNIIVIDNGRITAVGFHSELYMNNKIYTELYDLQREMYN